MRALRVVRRIAAVLSLSLLGSTAAAAQTLTFTVSGNPGTVAITTAVPGSNPTSVIDASTTYTITVTGLLTGKHAKVTGQLNQTMPVGTTLAVSLAAPSGATSLGAVSLTTAPQDLVTGISTALLQTLRITYTFSATPSAGVVSLASRTVTFTIVTY